MPADVYFEDAPATYPVCANCSQRVYRARAGGWFHCYTASDRCRDGRRAMLKRSSCGVTDEQQRRA